MVNSNFKTTNGEGITLVEWLLAAGVEDVKAVTLRHIEAWHKGEDPAEWISSYTRLNRVG